MPQVTFLNRKTRDHAKTWPRVGFQTRQQFLKAITRIVDFSYVRKHNRCDSEKLQCIVYNINFFQQIGPSPSRGKRSFLKKKLNIKSYDEAQDRQIKNAVRTFVKTCGLKSESLKDKKPEMI